MSSKTSKTLRPICFILISLLAIVLQSTVISPYKLGPYGPDLNLILIVFLGLLSPLRGRAGLSVFNGFLMDSLAAAPFGVHTLSRASVFFLLQDFSENVYPASYLTQCLALFLSTIYSWSFIDAAYIITGMRCCTVPFEAMIIQAVVNVCVGLGVFWSLKRLYEKL